MTKKSYTRTGNSCLVTFYLPASVGAEKAVLCGDFNNWDISSKEMKKKKDGTFYTSMHLDAGRKYRYRYFLDDSRWENDWDAEEYLQNDHGTDDSVVSV